MVSDEGIRCSMPKGMRVVPENSREVLRALQGEWTLRLTPACGLPKGSPPLFMALQEDGSPCLTLRCDDGVVSLELVTDYSPSPLRVSASPGNSEGYRPGEVTIRYRRHLVELFVNGILSDEEWPAGHIGAPVAILSESSNIELWSQALPDADIVYSPAMKELRLPESFKDVQYRKPRMAGTNAGDCMPFFHDGRFHLFYLLDRRHHGSKWGKGAHQWAHISTTDLFVWEEHPMAVPITEDWEGSICTGSVIFWDGIYHAFYAVRTMDGSPAPIMAAKSRDGVHFEKGEPLVALKPPYDGGAGRDPMVFQAEDGIFHMLVTTQLMDTPVSCHGGCLAHLTSRDLTSWEQLPPFTVPGFGGYPDYTAQPECPDYFVWDGWHYLIYSIGGVARHLMSRSLEGPWMRPSLDTFDGHQVGVMKTAPFGDGRRIGAAFIPENGYGGSLVFREILRNVDGTLAVSFVPEMIPDHPLSIEPEWDCISGGSEVVGDGIVLDGSRGFALLRTSPIPTDFKLAMKVIPTPGTMAFGLCVRGAGDYGSGYELRIEPDRGKVGWRGTRDKATIEGEGAAIYQVDGLDGPFTLDLIASGGILDICIDGKRTLAVRHDGDTGEHLFLFAHWGSVEFREISIKGRLAEGDGMS